MTICKHPCGVLTEDRDIWHIDTLISLISFQLRVYAQIILSRNPVLPIDIGLSKLEEVKVLKLGGCC